MASGSDDGTIRLWDIDTGEERHVLRAPDGQRMDGVYFLLGDTHIVSFDGKIRVWDVVMCAGFNICHCSSVSSHDSVSCW
jgi:WD40 repeat protein